MPCPFVESLWSSMHLPYLVCGTWPPLSTCLGGSVLKSILLCLSFSGVGSTILWLVMLLCSVLLWVVLMLWTSNLKCGPSMSSGSAVLSHRRLSGSLSWSFGSPPFLMPLLTLFFALPLPSAFYVSLLSAWQACKGSLSNSSTVIGSGVNFCPTPSVTTKSACLFLLAENVIYPYCVAKFRPLFGPLYWPATWHQLFFFVGPSSDRPFLEGFSWCPLHGGTSFFFWLQRLFTI